MIIEQLQQGRRGDWVSCGSCGEESLYASRDALDHVCSVCGRPRMAMDEEG